MRKVIDIISKEQWLSERLQDITSTEISALYDCNPYFTKYDLFFSKKQKKILEVEENERMKWGKALEGAIAQEAASRLNWKIEKLDVYMREEYSKIGSSFDYKIKPYCQIARPTPGILEIKNISYKEFLRTDNPDKKWEHDGNGYITKAPLYIELQLQHQLEVSDLEWGAIFVLVGTDYGAICIRERDRIIGVDIKNKAKKFWKFIENNEEIVVDIDEILQNNPHHIEKVSKFIFKNIIGSDSEDILYADQEMEDLIARYNFARNERESLEMIEDGLKAKIMQISSKYKKISSSYGNIYCKTRPETQGTLITQDMVGTHINARRAFREFRFISNREQ